MTDPTTTAAHRDPVPDSARQPARRRPLLRRLTLTAIVILGVLVVAVGAVKLLYGRGTTHPDTAGAPLLSAADVTALADMDFPTGNVTGSPDGRIFFNTHPLTRSDRFTTTYFYELVNGTPRPYPDQASQPDLTFAFGMTVDRQNRLWVTEPANLDRDRTRLIAYDLATNRKVIDHEMGPGVARFGQDLRITPDGKTVLLANPGAFRFTPSALTVVDIATWKARDVLAGSPAAQPQDLVIHTNTDHRAYRLGYGLLNFTVGLDGIAISPDGRWLYLAPMNSDTLSRVPVADIVDPALSPAELNSRVEHVAGKPLNDGITTTTDGSVLLTDVEHGGVDRITPSGRLQTLVRLPQVAWADGIWASPNGTVYFTDSAIPQYIDPLMRPPALDKLRAGRPYHLYTFHLPA